MANFLISPEAYDFTFQSTSLFVPFGLAEWLAVTISCFNLSVAFLAFCFPVTPIIPRFYRFGGFYQEVNHMFEKKRLNRLIRRQRTSANSGMLDKAESTNDLQHVDSFMLTPAHAKKKPELELITLP